LELLQYGRLVCPMRPGSGKTLVTLLAGYVLEAKRPLLIVPGKLVEPTKKAIARYGKDWRVSWWIHIKSYQQLARISHENYLEELDPDLILGDEAHKLKNKGAGITKRIKFFLMGKGKGRCRFIPLSGTFSDRNPENWEHLSYWALGDLSPLPHVERDAKVWTQAIGEGLSGPRARPGALLKWVDATELKKVQDDPEETLKLIREGFARRIRDTPAVVATDSPLPPISLIITRHELPSDPAIEDAFANLKKKWETPDGYPLTLGVHVHSAARQLKKGFFYIWEPRPPKDWVAAKREWGRLNRRVLAYSRTWVTELQVALAAKSGVFSQPDWVEWCKRHEVDPKAWERWQAIKASYEGKKRAVWISRIALDYCALWLKDPGIVWTEHTAFGEELGRQTGIPYHGSAGLAADGVHIEARPKKTPVISGMGSGEGLNLQFNWYRNLISDPMSLGRAWEQTLARTHREGNPEDEVEVDVLSGCRADEEAWDKALLDAEYLSRTDCLQRLTVADKIWDSPGLPKLVRMGHRWKDLSREED
jgi:hypothetical protein